MNLSSHVYAALRNLVTLRDPSPVSLVVGCSGGVDSTVLVDVLLKGPWQEYVREVKIAHVNFGLRGSESDGDEEFVRNLAAKWNINVEVLSIPSGEAPSSGIQEWARTVRYGFFNEVLAKNGVLVLGHNADDLAESTIFRLIRGSSWGNWTGMELISNDIFRPLLGVSRHEIGEYSDRHKVPYREDSSNAKIDYSRNRIRHQVMPVLNEIQKGASKNLVCSIEAAQSVIRWVGDNWTEEMSRESMLDVTFFDSLPKAMIPLALYKFVELKSESRCSVSDRIANQVSLEVERRFMTPRSWNLEGGTVLSVGGGKLSVNAENLGARYLQHKRSLRRVDEGFVLVPDAQVLMADLGVYLRNRGQEILELVVSPLNSHQRVVLRGKSYDVRDLLRDWVEEGSDGAQFYMVTIIGDHMTMVFDSVEGHWAKAKGELGALEECPLQIGRICKAFSEF